MPRLLHTADWQLGLKLRFIEGDRGAEARLERFAAVRRLAALARERSVDVVLVAGDVFDDNAVGADVLERAVDALRVFAPTPVLLLPGNHDAGTPDCVLRRLPALPHVRALLDREPVRLGALTVYPCPLLRRHERDDPTRHLPPRGDDATVRVAVAHGGAIDFDEQGETPNVIDVDAVLAKGFDYLALGDWHGVKEMRPRAWYAGAPEPTRFKEKAPGYALIVDLDGPGAPPRVEAVRVARTRWLQREWQLDADADVDALLAWLAALPERSATLVELTVVGSLSLAARSRLDAALDEEAGRFMHLRVDAAGLVVAPSEADFEGLGVEGFVAEAIRRLREGADPRDADALRLLHRLLTSGGEAC
jgi:hypothetical protein